MYAKTVIRRYGDKNKAPPKSMERAFFNVHWYYHYLSRLYSFIPHMFLHRFNGHLFPVKDTYGQGGLNIGLFKNLWEMLHFSCTAWSDDRDGNTFTDVFYKFNVKAAISTIFVDTVEELSMVSPESWILPAPKVYKTSLCKIKRFESIDGCSQFCCIT